MSRISRAARNAVLLRLSDAATGFVPLLSASMAAAGITAPPGFILPISFSLPSKNFYMADVDPESLVGTTPVTYPFLTLFSGDTHSTNKQKFQLFSGNLSVVINCYLSWKSGRVQPDFSTVTDCFEEAMVACFNSPAWAAWATGPVIYDGDIDMRKSAVVRGDENWRQILTFTLQLEVHTI